MRIVAGSHRGRAIEAPPGLEVRPTSDRVRESLFNILAHGKFAADVPLDGALVLDAFAGSGALGLEALSRGAAHAVFLDQALAALQGIERNVASLKEQARATLVQADALKPPLPSKVRGDPAPRTLVVLDPPYRSGLAAPALAALAEAGWLAPGALAAIELEASEAFALPEGFTRADERRYGKTRIVFARWGTVAG
ncbi:MAG TPA: 16S rRNA (guanine(966)-N(2))-methyltransferase RsmD [Alphaproteobacteria bacterium]|nr:16S rRNA (guanine(966)-N(2))-methyltransferase RsmD [Alphaproteobacteria bacterium]